MRLRKQLGGSRALIILFILLHGITLVFLVRSLIVGRWGHVGLCVLCIALYSLPALLGLVFRASIPPLLYGIAACFAAAANLGGEVSGLYLRLPFWDSALRSVSHRSSACRLSAHTVRFLFHAYRRSLGIR